MEKEGRGEEERGEEGREGKERKWKGRDIFTLRTSACTLINETSQGNGCY